jgi:VWFA-related protein
MRSGYLPRALKSYAVVAVLTAGCMLQSRGRVVAKPKRIGAVTSSFPLQVSASSGNVWLIFVDDLHVDFRNTGGLKNLLKAISGTVIHDGDMFGMLSSGPSSLSGDFTNDRKLLDHGIGRVSGAALKPSEILDLSQSADGPDEVRYRAKVALATAYYMMIRLEQVRERRKAFIYISNGYNFDPSPSDSRATSSTNPFATGGDKFSVPQLRAQLSELTRQAKRANVRIFAIDPRGLAGEPAIDPNLDRLVWQNYWTTTRNSLRVISEQTGGFALLDESDLAEGLTRINSAMRD